MKKRKVKFVKDVTYDFDTIKPIPVLGVFIPPGVSADLAKASGTEHLADFARKIGEDLKTTLIKSIDKDITDYVEKLK